LLCGNDADISSNDPIWICWWQGMEQMPDVVRACYNSIIKHAQGHPIRIITKDNFREFVSIPAHIMEKFNSGIISITHLSDILRFSLLYEHGGIWLDATMFAMRDFTVAGKPFFTLRGSYKTDTPSKARWTGFCIGGVKHNMFFLYMKEIFNLYWKTHDEMIDYLLIDYIIAMAYDSIPQIKSMLEGVPGSEDANINFIQDNYNKEFSAEVLKTLCSQCPFQKLTIKKPCTIYTPDKKLTFYGHIVQNN
jgi:hypothetical protein